MITDLFADSTCVKRYIDREESHWIIVTDDGLGIFSDVPQFSGTEAVLFDPSLKESADVLMGVEPY